MTSYLQRYEAGEHVRVWKELRDFGTTIRNNEKLYAEAQAVAQVTMVRVKFNIIELIYQLKKTPYIFTPYQKRFNPPPKSIHQHLQNVEQRVGSLPLSIKAFISVVGSVNLMGHLSSKEDDTLKWPYGTYPDPLVFEYSPSFFRVLYREWQEEKKGHFYLQFSPDEYHKENTSGGPAYSIKLPNGGVDALVENEWHTANFVEYLRICFRWGGFPGFSRSTHPPKEFLAQITKNIIPF